MNQHADGRQQQQQQMRMPLQTAVDPAMSAGHFMSSLPPSGIGTARHQAPTSPSHSRVAASQGESTMQHHAASQQRSTKPNSLMTSSSTLPSSHHYPDAASTSTPSSANTSGDWSSSPALTPSAPAPTAMLLPFAARVSCACSNCKKAKTRCDDMRPCGRCTRLGREQTCASAVHQRRGRVHPSGRIGGAGRKRSHASWEYDDDADNDDGGNDGEEEYVEEERGVDGSNRSPSQSQGDPSTPLMQTSLPPSQSSHASQRFDTSASQSAASQSAIGQETNPLSHGDRTQADWMAAVESRTIVMNSAFPTKRQASGSNPSTHQPAHGNSMGKPYRQTSGHAMSETVPAASATSFASPSSVSAIPAFAYSSHDSIHALHVAQLPSSAIFSYDGVDPTQMPLGSQPAHLWSLQQQLHHQQQIHLQNQHHAQQLQMQTQQLHMQQQAELQAHFMFNQQQMQQLQPQPPPMHHGHPLPSPSSPSSHGYWYASPPAQAMLPTVATHLTAPRAPMVVPLSAAQRSLQPASSPPCYPPLIQPSPASVFAVHSSAASSSASVPSPSAFTRVSSVLTSASGISTPTASPVTSVPSSSSGSLIRLLPPSALHTATPPGIVSLSADALTPTRASTDSRIGSMTAPHIVSGEQQTRIKIEQQEDAR